MSKILVTGANGFVGRHLIAELLKNSFEVVGLGGRDLSGAEGMLALDLTNSNEVARIDFSGIVGVIHLAGLAAVGPSFENPMSYIETNVGIEVNLFEAALIQNAKPRFLIVSSGSLYDPQADLPLTEGSRVLASSPYAVSKIGQEEMARYYGTRGFECLVARPFNHIGPGQGPGFIVPDITQQVIACEKTEADEVLVGNLDAKRDYTDVRDIARAYRLLLEKGEPGETYNICSGRALSGHEILEGIMKASGTKVAVKEDPAKMRPSDNPVIYGSRDKLSKATGWKPEISIESTLADVVADWRARKV